MVTFLVFSLSLSSDVLDRQLQSEFTANVLARAVHPIVMLGYLTSKPRSTNYNKIIESGKVKVSCGSYVCIVRMKVCVQSGLRRKVHDLWAVQDLAISQTSYFGFGNPTDQETSTNRTDLKGCSRHPVCVHYNPWNVTNHGTCFCPKGVQIKEVPL